MFPKWSKTGKYMTKPLLSLLWTNSMSKEGRNITLLKKGLISKESFKARDTRLADRIRNEAVERDKKIRDIDVRNLMYSLGISINL